MASGSASIADQAPSETGSSRHSDVRRSLPIYPYKQTASEPVGTSSRSRIMQRGAPSQGKASVIWRAIHSAVGWVVTLIQTRSPRSIRTITKGEQEKSKQSVTDGTAQCPRWVIFDGLTMSA